jgi:mRNA-degrading endonuclease RelE of RelBE toxin-antitoxin system
MIILATSKFDKSVQKLAKKYPSIPEDLLVLKVQLLLNPTEGTPLGKNCFKLRINISSKKQGKSGGARVITYVKITDKNNATRYL